MSARVRSGRSKHAAPFHEINRFPHQSGHQRGLLFRYQDDTQQSAAVVKATSGRRHNVPGMRYRLSRRATHLCSFLEAAVCLYSSRYSFASSNAGSFFFIHQIPPHVVTAVCQAHDTREATKLAADVKHPTSTAVMLSYRHVDLPVSCSSRRSHDKRVFTPHRTVCCAAVYHNTYVCTRLYSAPQ